LNSKNRRLNGKLATKLPTPAPNTTCGYCKAKIASNRKGKEYCDSKCRYKAWQERRAEKARYHLNELAKILSGRCKQKKYSLIPRSEWGDGARPNPPSHSNSIKQEEA
jgi:hypothetical protein